MGYIAPEQLSNAKNPISDVCLLPWNNPLGHRISTGFGHKALGTMWRGTLTTILTVLMRATLKTQVENIIHGVLPKQLVVFTTSSILCSASHSSSRPTLIYKSPFDSSPLTRVTTFVNTLTNTSINYISRFLLAHFAQEECTATKGGHHARHQSNLFTGSYWSKSRSQTNSKRALLSQSQYLPRIVLFA